MMKLHRVLVAFAALVFLGLGISFLFWPVEMAATIDLQLPSPMAVTDVRATYGGFEVGFGAFLLYCAFCSEHVLKGMLAAALAIGGFGVGRLIGIIIDGSPTNFMLAFLAIEFTSAAILGGLYWKASCADCATHKTGGSHV